MTSFPRTADEQFLATVREMKQAGVTVAVNTNEDHSGTGRIITRTVTITWQTHNTEAAVL